MIGEDHKRRQVLVRAAQTVADPAAQGGEPGSVETGRLQKRALRVNPGLADHVVNKRDLIDDITEWCNNLTQLFAAFPVRFEVPKRFEPRTQTVLERLDVFAEVRFFSVPFYQLRLEVEQIDVARATGHEELDDALGLGLVVQAAIRALWEHRREVCPQPSIAASAMPPNPPPE